MNVRATRVALVTGASKGFGRLIGERLSSQGWKVFGTSRRVDDEAAGPTGVTMLPLDVSDPASVSRCVSDLLERSRRVDLLVNNAGTTHLSLAELTPESTAERVLQTNLHGAMRITRALLPIMRRQGGGRIISIGSLAGLVPAPGQAYYCATKHGLEGFMETLRQEVRPFGIQVTVVEPGFFKTELHGAAARAEDGEAPDALQALQRRVLEACDAGFEGGDDPDKVARLVAELAERPRLRARYRVGRDAVWLGRLRRWLPAAVFEWGLRKRFRLDERG